MPELRKKYPFDKIEPKWQRYWAEHKTFAAREDSSKKKLYVLDMFPYPSGAGLHVGHPEGYTATDIYCRFQRMRGFNVLHPMGWDAFGLPAEQYAIKTGTHPAVTTRENIDTFRRQIQMLGFSYDWDREVDTTDPGYFRWTQWIFLQLYNSYYDKHQNKAQPIWLLMDALSESPQHADLWADNPYLNKIRRFLPTSDQSKRGFTVHEFVTNMRLAGEAEVPVWWCEGCKTVLANEEVNADGTCKDKGHSGVVRRPLRQWILKITAYAERLLEDLKLVDWPESIKEMQRNWIGRSEGTKVEFKSENGLAVISVFTTRPDTLFGATYLVLAPEHPQVDLLTVPEQREAVDAYRAAAAKKSELERTQLEKEKTGVFTGAYAFNPVNREKIPIWVADYVMMGYGTGAIMAVPAHDTRDFEFAKKFDLEIRAIVEPYSYTPSGQSSHVGWDGELKVRYPDKPQYVREAHRQQLERIVFDLANPSSAFVEDGMNINSPSRDVLARMPDLCNINQLPTPEAKKKITSWLEENGLGNATVNYKLRDWLFSRQRYWGEPIPIVHCEKHGTVPVPEDELPLKLPEMKDYSPSGSAEPPLAKATDWVNTKCPQCGGPAKRETNTMPQWAGSCWYYLRYIDPKNDREFVAKDKEKYWMPVDLYVGGAEHAVLHLLYSRFWHKVLFDLGHVSTPEPFMRLVNQGMILGEDNQKMSKSRGNVIPIDVPVAEFGADTLRVFEMFMGPLDMVKPWNTRGAEGVYRFLGRVWRLYCDEDGSLIVDESEPDAKLLKVLHHTIKKAGEDTESLKFNTAISTMMEFVNEVTAQESRPRALLEPFVLALAPYAPHLAEELWEKFGHKQSLAYEPWPSYDPSLLREDTVTVVLQVNGKLRDRASVPADIGQAEMEKLALANERVKETLTGKQIRKIVVVPGKLVNIVAG